MALHLYGLLITCSLPTLVVTVFTIGTFSKYRIAREDQSNASRRQLLAFPIHGTSRLGSCQMVALTPCTKMQGALRNDWNPRGQRSSPFRGCSSWKQGLSRAFAQCSKNKKHLYDGCRR